MAQIVAKAFDATKRIMQSIFYGAPNLFTTSDINRQIEAFKYQLDHIEKTLGYVSDMRLTASYDISTNTIEVITTGTYLEAFGCRLEDADLFTTFRINDVALDEEVYLIGQLTLQVLTYADDPQHTIVGALFDNQSSMPAADQIVITSAQYRLSKTVPADNGYTHYIALARIKASQIVDKLNIQIVPYFITGYNTPAISMVNEAAQDKQARRIYDTNKYWGYSGELAKVTDGLLHFMVYQTGGLPMSAPGGYNGNYPPRPGSANLMSQGWRAEWFRNFEFTYVNDSSQYYVKFIPLCEAVQGTGTLVNAQNVACSILSCRGGSIGITLYFEGGTEPADCVGIYLAAFLGSNAAIIARKDTDGTIFVADTNSQNTDFLDNIRFTCTGNFYLDLIAGSHKWRGLD